MEYFRNIPLILRSNVGYFLVIPNKTLQKKKLFYVEFELHIYASYSSYICIQLEIILIKKTFKEKSVPINNPYHYLYFYNWVHTKWGLLTLSFVIGIIISIIAYKNREGSSKKLHAIEKKAS